MALISIIEDFHPLNNAKYLDIAKSLKPSLHHHIFEPVGAFMLKERYSSEKESIRLHDVTHLSLGKGRNLCLDFGSHRVGRVSLALSYSGSHPDAPALLKLKFAETLKELSENSDSYDGWISSSWIQEEYVHVDVLPSVISLPRRYAFRYLKITLMDTSPKYKLVVKHAECLAESSAYMERSGAVSYKDPMLDRINEVGIRTLHNCMQDVFEDGPKRDRRLWMGDLRLQAQANYSTFRNNDLVKRCLYLFAGSRFPDGRVSACLFTDPVVEADDTWLFDYSLFFVVALEEYLEATGDLQALEDLYGVAMEQIDLALGMLGTDGILNQNAVENTFVDWCDPLDKSVCAQSVLIYALRFARKLALRKEDAGREEAIEERLIQLAEAAWDRFWDADQRCFVSGQGQVSPAGQVWAVLAGLAEGEEARCAVKQCESCLPELKMTTPYMHHYYVMALLACGMKEKALDHVKSYWGSMVEAGADTFWESWMPDDPEASPYGGSIINSYCHAWSCTPVYILKEFFHEEWEET